MCYFLNGVHMLKKLIYISLFLFGIILLIGCNYLENQNVRKVGMLIESSLHNHPWEERGYDGLLAIRDQYDVDIYLKEKVKSEHEIVNAVDELVKSGVTLIFGHGNIYGRYFADIASNYPDIHFVYFNGGYYADNVTSLNFDSHAMGFFSGMIAGKMTDTKQIGILAAHEWQPEIEGFYEGVMYEDPSIVVHIYFINDWNEVDIAIDMYERMKRNQVDVVYPAGELFSDVILERVVADNNYGIGYGADQSYIDSEAILTSTIQHVDKLYMLAAEKVMNQSLDGGILFFDFQDEVISLGKYSPDIPLDFQEAVNDLIDHYKKTNLLPNEQ